MESDQAACGKVGIIYCGETKMEAFSSWESLLLGVLVLLVIFWMRPGIKAALEQSRKVPVDWMAVLVPLGLVVLFVIFLMVMV